MFVHVYKHDVEDAKKIVSFLESEQGIEFVKKIAEVEKNAGSDSSDPNEPFSVMLEIVKRVVGKK